MVNMIELTDSKDLLNDASALRERASEDGYLFFRSLVDPESLANVRRQILALCEEHGWLKENTDPMEGIARPGVVWLEGQPEYMALYNRLICLEDFHALAHHPSLLRVADALFGGNTLVHPRNIARIMFPNAQLHTTAAHQDYVHIQGTPDTWTAWMPLGDCPRELGVLAILPGTHRNGIYPTRSAYGAGGLGIDTSGFPQEWRASALQSGDVLFFHSHTVHKALPNDSPDRLRLSVDFRYQSAAEPVCDQALEPHLMQVGWEQVYAGWKSDRFQYYWKDLPLTVVEWTPEYQLQAAATADQPLSAV